MTNTLTIVASSINGEIQDNPTTLYFKCDEVFAIGVGVVSDIDINFCKVNKAVFLIRCGDDIFGTIQFKNWAEWNDYLRLNCVDTSVILRIDGCDALVNGCNIVVR